MLSFNIDEIVKKKTLPKDKFKTITEDIILVITSLFLFFGFLFLSVIASNIFLKVALVISTLVMLFFLYLVFISIKSARKLEFIHTGIEVSKIKTLIERVARQKKWEEIQNYDLLLSYSIPNQDFWFRSAFAEIEITFILVDEGYLINLRNLGNYEDGTTFRSSFRIGMNRKKKKIINRIDEFVLTEKLTND